MPMKVGRTCPHTKFGEKKIKQKIVRFRSNKINQQRWKALLTSLYIIKGCHKLQFSHTDIERTLMKILS